MFLHLAIEIKTKNKYKVFGKLKESLVKVRRAAVWPPPGIYCSLAYEFLCLSWLLYRSNMELFAFLTVIWQHL